MSVKINNSLAPKELHAQQSKDHDEEEEKEQQADDRLHGVEQGYHKIPQWVPVPTNTWAYKYMQNYYSIINIFNLFFYTYVSDDSLGDFEDSEQSQSPKDADPKRSPRFDGSPDHLKNTPNNHLWTQSDKCNTPPQLPFPNTHYTISASTQPFLLFWK